MSDVTRRAEAMLIDQLGQVTFATIANDFDGHFSAHPIDPPPRVIATAQTSRLCAPAR